MVSTCNVQPITQTKDFRVSEPSPGVYDVIVNVHVPAPEKYAFLPSRIYAT